MTKKAIGAFDTALPTPRRRAILLLLGALTPVLAFCWAAAEFSVYRDAAEAAAREASTCQELAARIEQAGAPTRRESPADGAAPTGPADLATEITVAATTAGIDDRELERIETEPARLNSAAAGRGAGESDDARDVAARGSAAPLMDHSVQVTIRRATLEQMIRFLYSVSSSPERLFVRHLRITAPGETRGTTAANTWAIEATLAATGRTVPAVPAGKPLPVSPVGATTNGPKAAGVR